MHSNPILITFCSLLYYKDLDQHMRNHRIEKLLIPLDDSLKEYFILRPVKFIEKPSNKYKIHPILISLNYNPRKFEYNKKIVNRWHLFLRLSINIELTIYRRNKMGTNDAIDYNNEKLTGALLMKKLKVNKLFKRIITKEKIDENNIINNLETRF